MKPNKIVACTLTAALASALIAAPVASAAKSDGQEAHSFDAMAAVSHDENIDIDCEWMPKPKKLSTLKNKSISWNMTAFAQDCPKVSAKVIKKDKKKRVSLKVGQLKELIPGKPSGGYSANLKLSVKKGTKKGTYTTKVQVKGSGSDIWDDGVGTFTIKVHVGKQGVSYSCTDDAL